MDQYRQEFNGINVIKSKAPPKFKLQTAMGFFHRLFGAVTKGSNHEQCRAPSSIHFLNSQHHGVFAQPLEQTLLDTYSKQKQDCPKIQVVNKDGLWFALNSAQLHLYRVLELQGRCAQLRLDIIQLKDVPKDLMQMMVPPCTVDIVRSKSCDLRAGEQMSKQYGSVPAIAVNYELEINSVAEKQSNIISAKTSKGYHKLEATEVIYDEPTDHDDNNDVTEDDVSDSSDSGSSLFGPTDSELEWSDRNDTDSEFETDYDSTTDDDNNDEGDEKECLL